MTFLVGYIARDLLEIATTRILVLSKILRGSTFFLEGLIRGYVTQTHIRIHAVRRANLAHENKSADRSGLTLGIDDIGVTSRARESANMCQTKLEQQPLMLLLALISSDVTLEDFSLYSSRYIAGMLNEKKKNDI